MKKCVSAVLCIALALSICTHATAATPDELWLAAESLREQGIMVGDQTGSLHLDDSLTRAELAAILCRLRVNQEHIAAEETLYTRYCTFSDVPGWARVYVGYCAFNGLMVGYDTGAFGAGDSVTPAAACTVVLRHCHCRRNHIPGRPCCHALSCSSQHPFRHGCAEESRQRRW